MERRTGGNDKREGFLRKENEKLAQELISLSVGKKESVKQYYLRKIKVLSAVLIVGILLSIFCLLFYGKESGEAIQSISRPGYGEGNRTEELNVLIEGEPGAQAMEITVRERTYQEAEKQEFLDRAIDKLDCLLKGENESLDEVRSSLVFPKSLEDGKVQISWMTLPYGVLDEDGRLLKAEDETGTLVEIQGTLSCSGREAVYSAYAKVFPPDLSEQERLYQSVKQQVERTDSKESHKERLQLPQSVDGKRIRWQAASENPVQSVIALTLLAVVSVYIQMDNQVHKKAEARKNQLMLEYPDFMWKMTMLLGAGLTIKGAFTRIAGEYAREKKEALNLKKRTKFEARYVYEEIMYTCIEMESGIPEAQAYERFGKRCQLPGYIRIGTVLSQNLKKGARGLTSLLETEAETSFNERKSHARKIGERAGTKLLLPMVLMLAVVLAILMVPAFMAF